MKLELKNVKHAAFASQETHCFEATLYVDGKRFATVSNEGHGGCNYEYPIAPFTYSDLKKLNEMMVDKYEDKFEEYEKANEDLKKANTQLLLNVEDLKGRLFGHFERKLKNFALRPDKKRDN